MSYTATITKEKVTQIGTLYQVTIEVVINDGVEDVLTFYPSEKYNPAAPNMDSVKSGLQAQIKAKCDEFKDNKDIFDATAFTSLVTTLQTQTNSYISSWE